ncbi:MAG: hypothetical protein WCI19_07415 [Betaproteobacteria bacterium]|nr:hypothetical protein [Rhodocyclales bacterium]
MDVKVLVAAAGLIVLASTCDPAMADDLKAGSSAADGFDPRNSSPRPVEKIIKEGRRCYRETTVEKMVEACYEGKTYFSPVTEKSRVKIKCPAK